MNEGAVRILADEFSVLLDPKTTLTPHLCRKGCKHYDGVKDVNDGEFKEFCWFESSSCRIKAGERCVKFADGKPKNSEGLLGF